jgi:hypothetical protein
MSTKMQSHLDMAAAYPYLMREVNLSVMRNSLIPKQKSTGFLAAADALGEVGEE